ncbi:MAG: C-type lectin domain-containing protein [Verrucomicrobiota bacterium]
MRTKHSLLAAIAFTLSLTGAKAVTSTKLQLQYMKAYRLLLAALLAAALIPVSALRAGVLAGPILNPANNHHYYLLTTNTWSGARAEAVALGGDLVNIQDAAEETFVWSAFGNWDGSPRNLWLGLRRLTPGGPFIWVDGSPVTYNHWLPGEPSNDGGNENYALIYAYAHVPSGIVGGWNDVPDAGYPDMPPLAEIHGVVEVRSGLIAIACPGTNGLPCTITSEDVERSVTLEDADLVIGPKVTFIIHGQHHIASIECVDFNAITIIDTTNTFIGKVKSGHYALAGGSVLRAGDVNLAYGSQIEVRSALVEGNPAPGGIGATLIASNVTVAAGASITGAGLGFQGGYDSWGYGPGTAVGYDPIGGASHGGKAQSGRAPYGSAMQPVTLGSAGSGKYVDGWSAGTGGNGGSALHLQVSGTLALEGEINMDGLNAILKGGGGAGGSVWIEAANLIGNGRITACGGSGGGSNYDGPKSGGGGRVAVYYTSLGGFTGLTNCSVAGGWLGTSVAAQAGTMGFFDISGGINQFKLWVPQDRFAADADYALLLSEIHLGGLLSTNPLLDLSATHTVQASNILADAGTLQLGQDSFTLANHFTISSGATARMAGGALLEAGTLDVLGTNSGILFESKNVSEMVSNQWVGAGGMIAAGTARIDAGAFLSADGQGYIGSYNAYGRGPGAAGPVGGGGHGGYGATGGGPAYGNSLAPETPGSSGGGAYVDGWFAGTGGNGGGAIRLIVTNRLALDGTISANGSPGGWDKSGGGAGGSVWLEAGALTGAGQLSAIGGNGSAYGGGGGGRIALYSTNTADLLAWTNATVLAGQSTSAGQNGTLIYVDTSLGEDRAQCLVPAYRCDFTANPPWFESFAVGMSGLPAASVEVAPGLCVRGGQLTAREGGRVWLGGGAELRIDGTISLLGSNTTLQAACRNISAPLCGEWLGEGVFIQASNLVVTAGASMMADAQGYYADWGSPGRGPGGSGGDGGGGYGGNGGRGGPTYGLLETPTCPGSAGGGRTWRQYWGTLYGNGGSGGGVILLQVPGTVTLDGVISANGGNGWNTAGGGAGGSLWLEAGTLAGTGFLSANGGNGSDSSGGGGGGRIAIYSPQMAGFDLAHVTVAGSPFYSGADGTIYTGTSAPPLLVIAQTPTNTVTRVVEFIDLAFNAPLAATNFTTADLAFTTPSGPVPAGQLAISRLGANLWRVRVPRETNEGAYTLTIGADVTSLFGQSLASAYTGTFAITNPVLSGFVRWAGGTPVPNVLLSVSGSLPTRTDTSGAYRLALPPGWGGTVTPEYPGWSFIPTNRVYADLAADASSEDFAATLAEPLILTTTRSGTALSFRWPSARGLQYRIQWATNLPATSWLDEGVPVPGTGGVLSTNLPLGPEPAKFYRLQIGN